MEKTVELLTKMEGVLDQLITQAQDLIDLSKSSVAPEELANMQKQQEKWVDLLQQYDADLANACEPDTQLDAFPQWNKIQKQLDYFQTLNNTFIQNLSTRKGIIQFEVNDVKKTRKSLREMKTGYVKSKKKGTSSRPGDKPRLDTMS